MTQPIKQTRKKIMRSAHSQLFGTGDLNRVTRCSIIVAHPADEVFGAGCLISKLVDVTVLHVTDGARKIRRTLNRRDSSESMSMPTLASGNVSRRLRLLK